MVTFKICGILKLKIHETFAAFVTPNQIKAELCSYYRVKLRSFYEKTLSRNPQTNFMIFRDCQWVLYFKSSSDFIFHERIFIIKKSQMKMKSLPGLKR